MQRLHKPQQDRGGGECHDRLTRYPSLQEFVIGYLSGSPMAGALTALTDTPRAAMVEHVCAALKEYVDDDGMAAPWEAHFLTAWP